MKTFNGQGKRKGVKYIPGCGGPLSVKCDPERTHRFPASGGPK